MPKIPPATYTCEVCQKPVSRLHGVAATVELQDDGRRQTKTAALGYCGSHRENVIPAWVQNMSELGETELISDEPIDLRPRDVAAFLEHANRTLAEGVGGYRRLEPGEGVPTECPHCSGTLVWGEGPHASDPAVVEKRAFAWECRSCGAAGLLSLEG